MGIDLASSRPTLQAGRADDMKLLRYFPDRRSLAVLEIARLPAGRGQELFLEPARGLRGPPQDDAFISTMRKKTHLALETETRAAAASTIAESHGDEVAVSVQLDGNLQVGPRI